MNIAADADDDDEEDEDDDEKLATTQPRRTHDARWPYKMRNCETANVRNWQRFFSFSTI